jgi:hypothetical protein
VIAHLLACVQIGDRLHAFCTQCTASRDVVDGIGSDRLELSVRNDPQVADGVSAVSPNETD